MTRLLIAAVTLASLASCSTSGSSNSTLGCTTDLGSAENTYDHSVAGIGKTNTIDDAAKGLDSVKSSMEDLAVVNSDPQIKAKAQDAANHAAAIRVAMVDGGGMDSVSLSDVNALHADINAMDSRCSALGAFK